MWYRIEVQNYSEDRHIAISQQLRDMGYNVIHVRRYNCSWTASEDPLDELMLPLKLAGCEVTKYEDLEAALGSQSYKDFDVHRGH